MKIRLEQYSRVGNNVLVNMYFDDLLINPSGPLQMSPSELAIFIDLLKIGGAQIDVQ